MIDVDGDPNEIYIISVYGAEDELITHFTATTMSRAEELVELAAEFDEQLETFRIMPSKLDTLNQYDTVH